MHQQDQEEKKTHWTQPQFIHCFLSLELGMCFSYLNDYLMDKLSAAQESIKLLVSLIRLIHFT